MNLGKNILELRKQKNITQEELACELGVTAAAVSKWENNYTFPDILMLCALADYFEVTTDKLLGRVKEGRYAAISAQDETLLQKLEALAHSHGITALYLCSDFQSALDYANADIRVSHLVVSCEEARFTLENRMTRPGIHTIVSVGGTHQEILKNVERLLAE